MYSRVNVSLPATVKKTRLIDFLKLVKEAKQVDIFCCFLSRTINVDILKLLVLSQMPATPVVAILSQQKSSRKLTGLNKVGISNYNCRMVTQCNTGNRLNTIRSLGQNDKPYQQMHSGEIAVIQQSTLGGSHALSKHGGLKPIWLTVNLQSDQP